MRIIAVYLQGYYFCPALCTNPSRFQQESMMGEFDTIRPYDDTEVPAVLARLLSDKAFLDILTTFASRAWLALSAGC